MGLFGNRRRQDFNDSPVPDRDFNEMTGAEEKRVFSTDMQAQQTTATKTVTADVNGYGFEPASVVGERPRVFTSRENSGIYIYEYSDRLEHFVKLENSMFRFNVVNKR